MVVGNTLRSMAMKRGQIAVALILVMIPLLGAIGLGSDLGLLYFHWGILQKAADAAVLAGAGYLPNHPSTAQTTATGYATKNGVRTTEITSNTVAADNMSITMTTSRTVPYYFLQLVGVTSGTVKPIAKAGIQQDTEQSRGLIPVGLPCTSTSCSYTTGTLYQLVQAGANGASGGSWSIGPGNWGRLALGGSGADQFLNNLINGYQGSINVGGTVNAETGQVNGPTSQGVDDRVNTGMAINGAVANPTLATVPAYDPRLVAVPLVDFTGATGTSTTVPVMGFALMWLDSYTSKGANKTLNAYFLGTVPVTSVPSTVHTFGQLHPILLQ
ncbi:MAG: pilus assembly protein TadG-related protein [Candidatus Binataceae bacterium]